GRTAHVLLDAAALPAVTSSIGAWQRVVAPLACDALQARPEATVRNDTASGARAQNNAEDDSFCMVARGTEGRLCQRKTIGIVLESDRPPQRAGQVVAKWAAVQTYRVRVLHETAASRNAAGHPDANRHRQDVEAAFACELAHQGHRRIE